MDTWARDLALLLGAALGLLITTLSGTPTWWVLGGLIALAVGEILSLNSRLKMLADDVELLQQALRGERAAARRDVTPAPVASAAASVASAAAPVAAAKAAAPRVAPTPVAQPIAATAAARVEAPPVVVAPAPEWAPVRWVHDFLTGGNAVVRVGIIILLFGIGFLLRYLAEHSRVPIEWRLAGIALGGVALLALGWRLRVSRSGYALALQGGGIGILYLTVFAALRLYALLPAGLAFPLLVAVAVLSAVLAVSEDSLSLAWIGTVAGFLAPVLASNGQGSHVVLFSYYALLDVGILGLAWFKAWRPLNLAGFVFTFVIGTVWGVLRYRPELFASTEPFLVLFFALYVAIAVLFTLRQPVRLSGYIDGTLVFGTPLVVLALQSTLLLHQRPQLAASAALMGALYLALAWLLARRASRSQGLLAEAFLAIGVACATLAVPLAFHARLNAAVWALEGLALVWVGCRQQRVLARAAGALLALASGLIVANEFDWGAWQTNLPSAAYPGAVLQSLATIAAAAILDRHRQRLRTFELEVPALLLGWGLVVWLLCGHSEIAQLLPQYELAASLMLVTVTTLACSEMAHRLAFAAAKVAALLQFPLMMAAAAVAVAMAMTTIGHPAAHLGWLAWPLAFCGLYRVMYLLEGPARGALAHALHAGAIGLGCGMVGWEAAWQLDRALAGSDVWWVIGWAALPLCLLGLLPRLVHRVDWPFIKHREVYLGWVSAGLAAYLMGWSVLANVASEGDFAPLPYLPLVNPLDIVQALVLTVLLRYVTHFRAVAPARLPRVDPHLPMQLLVTIGFVWMNAILLRTLHEWCGVPYDVRAWLDSTLVQTSLSILWALLAFGTMLVAARRRWRAAWLAGAALMGVVIAKLFLVDLSRVDSLERIVSFVGVGLLMLVVGYVSPLPPAVESPDA